MGDLSTLVQDPQFRSFDSGTQRAVLTRIDPTFGTLDDNSFHTFLARAQNSGPPLPKPPVPAGLQGPPPGVMSQALQNLPGSAANLVRSSFPPTALYDQTKRGVMNALHPETAPGVGDIVSGIARPYIHPEDSFAEDPLGTIGAWAPVGEGVRRVTPPATRSTIAGVRAGAPDLLKGGAKTAIGGALAKFGPLGEIGDVLAGIPLVKSGLGQMGTGLRGFWNAAKGAWEPISSASEPATVHPLPGGEFSSTPVTPALVPPILGPGNIGGVEEYLRNRPNAARKGTSVSSDIPDIEQQRILDYATKQRAQKDAAMASYFKANNIGPDEIRKMGESEYNTHVKAAGKRPSTGVGYSREHSLAIQHIIDLMSK